MDRHIFSALFLAPLAILRMKKTSNDIAGRRGIANVPTPRPQLLLGQSTQAPS
jgi:hypothetical protein